MRAIVCLALALAGCSGPVRCERAAIVVERHPSRPKPAGRIFVGCDGRVVVVLDADEVVQ